MREISLHILDLIENSIRAGSSLIAVVIEEDRKRNELKIILEDNGPGLNVPPEQALDPFYTTKTGKKVGLGLSLFRASAEQAGGGLTIDKSVLGGVAVTVTMRLQHIDRMPLGNLAATLSSVVCTNPQVNLHCRFQSGGHEFSFSTAELAAGLKLGECQGLAVARQVAERIQSAIKALELST